jgi:tetratricopeptide (TPR) repeat protein
MLGLISCEDKASQPTTQRQQAPATNAALPIQGMEQLKARVAMNPMDFAALSDLADMYFESGQYIDAFQYYDKAIAVNPNCADCYNDRGLCLFYIGDPVSALESFDKAIAIDPAYKHAWLSKGYVLISSNRYQEAVAPLNKVKELDGTGPLAVQADKFLAMVARNTP